MSCTIYYKGTLKDNYNTSDVFNIITKHIKSMNVEIVQSIDSIIINFLQGRSESLIFDFYKKKIDNFFKWNGEDPEEFYKIFDMFIDLKTLFKSLKIDDDDGLWYEYIAQKKPCKITLRTLSSDENKLLERIYYNIINPPTEPEKFIMDKSRLTPYNKDLLRIICQDFIKILNKNNINDFDPHTIINLSDELNCLEFFGYKPSVENFDFDFSKILMLIWIGYAFEYKKIGIVKDLSINVKGLKSSIIAAIWGVKSIFLNQHCGGSNNSKEAEMYKLAKKYYRTGALGEVMVIDKPEIELEFLFSMMDYLGFNYININ